MSIVHLEITVLIIEILLLFYLKTIIKVLMIEFILDPLTMQFSQTVFLMGNGVNEFICDTLGQDISNVVTNVLFDHCSVKSEDTIENYILNNCYFNTNNYFKSPEEWIFELTDSSQIINLGKTSLLTTDIMNNPRTTPNDLGCYEYQ